ncbi:MAG: hypothetical protein RLZZ546_1276 [Bacteroidota bacterium]|jgi:hypothetical protein
MGNKIDKPYQINFNYEIMAIKADKKHDFDNYRAVLINGNRDSLKKVLEAIKVDFSESKALKSSFIEFKRLTTPKNSYDYFIKGIDNCLKHLDPKVLDDRNYFTNISMDITIASFFHYYMNGIDNQLWNYRPYYYMSESLISENNLDYLYDKSDSIELNSRLFTEFDQWKIISYKDIEEYFLNVKPMNELDKFFQNYFRDAMDKKLIIVINKSDS